MKLSESDLNAVDRVIELFSGLTVQGREAQGIALTLSYLDRLKEIVAKEVADEKAKAEVKD